MSETLPTLDEICDTLTETRDQYGWRLTGRDRIIGTYPTPHPPVSSGGACCPLLAYAHAVTLDGSQTVALFRSRLGRLIMDAADNKPGHDTDVRQQLLTACGCL
jgi:hypothetical protein